MIITQIKYSRVKFEKCFPSWHNGNYKILHSKTLYLKSSIIHSNRFKSARTK